MRTYRCKAVADLGMQLVRGPSRHCLRHLYQIEFLLSVIEPGKSYPFDFVQHALTGFRAASVGAGETELLDGASLREDLVGLAEDLSDTAVLPAEACEEPIFSVTELAKRFGVSTKTVFRWRQRGLVGWRVRYADRRGRVAFAERCIRRFVAENTKYIVRGRSFSQLTPQERENIIRRGAELARADGRRTVNAVAREIAGECGRAIETIRIILKAHDESHPNNGIFNRSPLDVEPDDCRLQIWEAHVDGASVEELARRFERSIAWVYRTITQMRARDCLSRKIEYVYSPEFDAPDADHAILDDPHAKAPAADVVAPRVPADLAPYLQQLFRIPLLTAEGEAALFRKYNYLKHKADNLRRALDPESVRPVQLDRIEQLLAQAGEVKNQITQANLRLGVSIAKRHVRGGAEFFEVVSDGNVSLMKAVEKFDYTRGFKFSTYGSWAIIKNYARSVPEQAVHADRYQTGRDEYIETVSGPRVDDAEDDALPAIRNTLDRMLDALSDREQRILRKHFGLDNGGQTMTLEEIGRQLGVSKERIRQIESRAMGKLRGEFQVEVSKLLGS